MDNIKKRAELADICYMTIERECAKPVQDINTELVMACIELADLLLGIQPISDDGLTEVKQKLYAMTRRRKSLKIRIIAAVVAVLLLLGTTIYAFSDWIYNVFGLKTIQTIQSGDKVVMGDNDLAAAIGSIEFKNSNELYKYANGMIMLPSEESNAELINATYDTYNEYNMFFTIWKINNIQINYIVTLNSPTINKKQFDTQGYEYYSQHGQPYDIIDIGIGFQAATIIDQTQYTIKCTDKETLIEFIDMIE